MGTTAPAGWEGPRALPVPVVGKRSLGCFPGQQLLHCSVSPEREPVGDLFELALVLGQEEPVSRGGSCLVCCCRSACCCVLDQDFIVSSILFYFFFSFQKGLLITSHFGGVKLLLLLAQSRAPVSAGRAMAHQKVFCLVSGTRMDPSSPPAACPGG